MTDERLAELGRRLQRIEDERAVERLIASYGPLVDAGEADTVSQLWATDGSYDVAVTDSPWGGRVPTTSGCGESRAAGRSWHAPRARSTASPRHAMADAANPMGRMGDPYDDIAPVAVFLAGDACRYLTGNTLFVDGGSHINGVAWAPDLDAE